MRGTADHYFELKGPQKLVIPACARMTTLELGELHSHDHGRVVERDPYDDRIIACAIAARADANVSGDNDLRDLGRHQDIPIISVREALARIR